MLGFRSVRAYILIPFSFRSVFSCFRGGDGFSQTAFATTQSSETSMFEPATEKTAFAAVFRDCWELYLVSDGGFSVSE